MTDSILGGAAIVLVLLLFPSLWRAAVGPTTADRLVAVNMIATKVVVLICLLAAVTGRGAFVDVAFVYAMIGFIATVAISRVIERGKAQ